MGSVNLAIDAGFKVAKEAANEMKLIPRKGAEITENPFVVQTLKNVAGDYTKVVSFPEGSPMRKLGITDAVCTRVKNGVWAHTGTPEEIRFFRNPEGVIYSADGSLGWSGGSRLYVGSIEKAKGFIEALKEMASNGVKLFGG